MIKQVLLVGAGGAIGSILRFLTSELTSRYYTNSFPLATFLVNVVGCFIIGILINMTATNSNLKMILIVGFCGGFTTFSTFARETLDLVNNHQLPIAIAYTVLSCLLGILAVWLGISLTK